MQDGKTFQYSSDTPVKAVDPGYMAHFSDDDKIHQEHHWNTRCCIFHCGADCEGLYSHLNTSLVRSVLPKNQRVENKNYWVVPHSSKSYKVGGTSLNAASDPPALGFEVITRVFLSLL